MRSLRGRLTLGMTLVLGTLLALAGGMVSRYVDHSERNALDDRLKRTAELSRETALAAVDQELPNSDNRLDAVLSATGTALRIRLAGQVLVEAGQRPPAWPARSRSGLSTFTEDGARYRLYVTSLRDPSLGGLARLEVTTRLRSLEHRQAALNRRLAAFGLAALLLAAGGVWFATDLVLRPLRRLRLTTARIADTEDLDQRVAADDGPAELRSLAASFNDMLARLGRSSADRERALAATRRFAADAGHELRTPLTSVQATLGALALHPDIPEAQRTELVRAALGEHRRLVDLLDGLQALARGDAAPGEQTDVDLAELVATAVDEVAGRYPAVSWRANVPEHAVTIHGWEPGLRSLVDNLLINAARHGCPAGGTVDVSLIEGANGAAGTLHVDDDGPGIAEDQRERVLEPFVRAPGTETPGSGLGLAVAAQQGRAHGAVIEIGRSPLGGARFTVRFDAT